MEKEELELVSTHCKHKDCVYRSHILLGSRIPVCMYAVLEGKARGCSISECDKYISGKKTKAKMREDTIIYWETELYGRTDDNPLE